LSKKYFSYRAGDISWANQRFTNSQNMALFSKYTTRIIIFVIVKKMTAGQYTILHHTASSHARGPYISPLPGPTSASCCTIHVLRTCLCGAGRRTYRMRRCSLLSNATLNCTCQAHTMVCHLLWKIDNYLLKLLTYFVYHASLYYSN